MTKKVISNEMEILKKLHDNGMSIPLDLNDIKAVIDYVEDLESKIRDYEECFNLVVNDLKDHDYIHIVFS